MTNTESAPLAPADAVVLRSLAELVFQCNSAPSFEMQSVGSAMDHVCKALRVAFLALPGVDERAAEALFDMVLDGADPVAAFEEFERGEL